MTGRVSEVSGMMERTKEAAPAGNRGLTETPTEEVKRLA